MHFYTIVFLVVIDFVGIILMSVGYRMHNNQVLYRSFLALRTKYALESEENWNRIHRAMAMPTMKLGVFFCVLTIVPLLLEILDGMGLFIVLLTALLIVGSFVWYWQEYLRILMMLVEWPVN